MRTTTRTWYEETPLSEAWKYVVTETIAFPNIGREQIWNRYDIHALDGPLLADLTPEYGLRIFPGYMFDGATFAPDCRPLFPAFVLHDILCQCATRYPRQWPISRPQADREFLSEGLRHAPLRARIYYAGIRLGGGLINLLTPSPPESAVIIRKS